MKQRKLSHWLSLAVVLGIGAATLSSLVGLEALQAQVIHNRPPPTASKPLPVKDLRSAIDQTAAIIEGLVTDIQYDSS
jgi:hypothetical protein